MILAIITWVSGATELHPASAGMIYYMDASDVRRADLDGSNGISLVDLITVPSSAPTGIAIDESSQHIYWVESNGGGAINRINFDGTGNTTLTTYTYFPQRVALDLPNGHIYYSDMGHDIIRRTNLDGSSPTNIVGSQGPSDVELDLANGFIYWGDYGEHKIYRSDLDGSNRQVIVSNADAVRGIAIDPANNTLFWGGANALKTKNLDGTGAESVVLAVGAISDVEVDPASGEVYWSDYSGTGFLRRANYDGSGEITLLTANSQGGLGDFELSLSSVLPEPSSFVIMSGLFGMGLIGGWWRRRRVA